MSERYVPPPPPYQPSIQHDQKVTEEVHSLEPSKTDSSRDGEWNDSKYSLALTGKAALHSISKYPTKLDGASFKGRPRPLPSRPVDPPSSRVSGYKLDSIAEMKSHAAQNDHSIKLRSTASMLFPAPSLGEPTHRLSSSVQPSPPHYASQSSYDTPRRTRNDRWPVPGYPSLDPGVEPSSRRSSAVQSPLHSLPNKNSLGMRLSFDPSVAYSDSQTNTPATLSTRREAVAASLYTSAVSSHLPLDYPTYGSRQPYASMRPMSRGDETARRDDADWQSLRSLSSRPPDSMSSRTSVYSLRPKTSSGYETRWAASETDFRRDIYRR